MSILLACPSAATTTPAVHTFASTPDLLSTETLRITGVYHVATTGLPKATRSTDDFVDSTQGISIADMQLLLRNSLQ